jgi:uncharacterized membrane protein YfcA
VTHSGIAFILSAFVAFTASCVQAITGFGFAVAAMPLLLSVYGVKDAVNLVLVLQVLQLSLMRAQLRGICDRGLLGRLVLGGLIGIVPGVYLTRVLGNRFLSVGINTLVLVALSSMWLGGVAGRAWGRIRFVQYLCGLASGLLTGSAGLPGPPVVLALVAVDVDREVFRLTLVTYFLWVTVAAVAYRVLSRLVGAGVFLTSLALVPLLVAGQMVGLSLASKFDEVQFRRFVSIFVGGAAVFGIASHLI